MVKVNKTDTCWLWTAAKFDNGYGAFKETPTKQVRAHRWSYEHFVGPIPDGLILMHTCDVPACVNPDHLQPGTQAENQQDMVRKGRLGLRPQTSKANIRKGRAKLSPALAAEIRERYAQGGCTYRSLGREYGVHNVTIGLIVRHEIWND